MSQKAMTLSALKDALSTYGVNNDERSMPVTVRMTDPDKGGYNEAFYIVTEAEVVYSPSQSQLLLQAIPDRGETWSDA